MTKKYLTRTINLATYLVRIYHREGRTRFLEELTLHGRFVCEQFEGEPREMDKHLDTLVNSILSPLWDHQPDKVIRVRADFGDEFRRMTSPKAKVTELVREFDHCLAKMEEERAEERLSERVVDYLKKCPMENLRQLTVDSLAEVFGYSKNYFAERFKMEHSVSVHEILTHEKMNRAFTLLSREDDPPTVKEVARTLGFSDAVYFSRLFRKKYGFLPSKLMRF
jgi:AraC-like DNA-binding protein